MKVVLRPMSLVVANIIASATTAEAVGGDTQCDETKCLSPAFFSGTDCWALGPDTWKPNTCADGYEAQDLSSVATLYVPEGDSTYWYYACCPPAYSGSLPQEGCTDQVCTSPDGKGGTDCWADSAHEPMTCGGDVYRFPRHTTLKYRHYSRWYYFYVCCTTDDGTPPLQRRLVVGEGMRITLAGLALCCSFILISGILLSREVRGNAFNLYLVFLTLPDVAFNACAIAIGSMTLSGTHISCHAMHFFSYFYAAANIWLNAVVAHQVYALLRISHGGAVTQTHSPSVKNVSIQASIVYFIAVLMGIWGALFPCGNVLGPTVFDDYYVTALALTWTVIAAVPLLYMIYICIRVWTGNLLSLSAYTRVIAFYFLRLVVVFFVFWIPSIVLANIERQDLDWEGLPLHYVNWYLASLQTVASVTMTLTKLDVRSAVKSFLLCHWTNGEKDDTTGPTSRPSIFRHDSTSSLTSSLVMGFRRKSSKQNSGGEETKDDEEAVGGNSQVSAMEEQAGSSDDVVVAVSSEDKAGHDANLKEFT